MTADDGTQALQVSLPKGCATAQCAMRAKTRLDAPLEAATLKYRAIQQSSQAPVTSVRPANCERLFKCRRGAGGFCLARTRCQDVCAHATNSAGSSLAPDSTGRAAEDYQGCAARTARPAARLSQVLVALAQSRHGGRARGHRSAATAPPIALEASSRPTCAASAGLLQLAVLQLLLWRDSAVLGRLARCACSQAMHTEQRRLKRMRLRVCQLRRSKRCHLHKHQQF